MYDPIRQAEETKAAEIIGHQPDDDELTADSADEPAIVPAWERGREATRRARSHTQTFDPHPEIPMAQRHNFVITDDALGEGGVKAKFQYNVAAIKTLQAVEAENRFATPDEQEVLSRYVGWGGLPQVFDEKNDKWANEYAELQALLTSQEYESARASTLNAHYTSPIVIKAIYKAVEGMGFRAANILEPSCGIGNFMGLLPESMGGSKLFGVELDGVTGRIARQLYQKNNIAIQGYENTDLPDSFFDLAIGNVPFGSYSVNDKRYDKNKFHIHDYFFAKTLDKVRPGGVIAFVTSKYTMDKQNPAVRKYIAQRAELLGAIRLPCDAFKANAGTEVATDILFLQKRDRVIDVEPDWVHLGEMDGIHDSAEEVDGAKPIVPIPVNAYFAEHPEMIMGRMALDDRMNGKYGRNDTTTCLPTPGADLSEQLATAITNIRAEMDIADYTRDDDALDGGMDTSIPADPNVRNYSYTVVDGKIYFRQDSRMYPQEPGKTAASRIKGMMKIRDCVRKLIAYQTEDYPDHVIQAEQGRLNRLYDDYTKQYGLLNSRGNGTAFAVDSSYSLLCSLEILDENGELARKADMFARRTIKPHIEVTHVDTANEALAVSMGEKAGVDLPFMAELTGFTTERLITELEGVIYCDVSDPNTSLPNFNPDEMKLYEKFPFVMADEYLSGNVREKLRKLRDFHEAWGDSFYGVNIAGNIQALEAAQPVDLTAAEIDVRLGATWVPPDVVQQFIYELLDTPWRLKDRIRVFYSPYTGNWQVSEKSRDKGNVLANSTYGTERVSAYAIIEDTLNLRDAKVFDSDVDPNGNKIHVLAVDDTAVAQSKQDIIKEKFQEWIWKDPRRRERLCKLYNEQFNSLRPREYNGEHILFHGANPEIKLRASQVNAIARGLYGGNALFAHDVGAGKTFAMIATIMERKRLGLCHKSMIVVPGHITEQWGGAFLQLYPSANILVATQKDFQPRNRRKFFARIATGDYDAVIVGHSQFEKIPLSDERQRFALWEQLNTITDGIADARKEMGAKSFTIKQMEQLKKSLEARLEKLNDQSKKDKEVTFEELGIDMLCIDEAHYYKNLYLVSKMRNVGGIQQTNAKKASDLFMKTRYLDDITGVHLLQ